MAKHKFPYKFTDETINSLGFSVVTSGINLDRFKSNPVVLKNHNDGEPIGLVEELSATNGELSGVVVIDDTDDPALEKIVRDINKGLYKGCSMTLGAKDSDLIQGNPPKLVKSEMMELSICPVPSNKNALQLSFDGKKVTPEEISIKLSALADSNKNSTMNKILTFLLSMGAVFKLTATATEDHAIEAIKAMMAENEQLKKDNGALTAKLSATEDEKVTDLVEHALSANKIKADEKAHWAKLAKADFASTKGILDGMKGRVSLSGKINNKGEGENAGEDSPIWMRDNLVKLSYRELQKSHSKVLSEMRDKDWDRYSELYEQQFGKKPTK